MLAFVLPSFARFCMATKLGIAMAARMPIITTTIISSIRVKPFCPFFTLISFPSVERHESEVVQSTHPVAGHVPGRKEGSFGAPVSLEETDARAYGRRSSMSFTRREAELGGGPRA